MPTRLATALGLAMVLSTLAGVAQASVGTSCSFDAGTATVTATIGSAASPTLIRNGTSVQFDGNFCGLATVTNTEHIDIDAPDATTTESLTISLAGGAFTDGTNEIAIAANLAQTKPLAFVGMSGPDDFSIRSSQANLNADTTNTFEVTYPIGARTITVDGGPVRTSSQPRRTGSPSAAATVTTRSNQQTPERQRTTADRKTTLSRT